MNDNGGIIALSGFTYQIKVFFYYLSFLEENDVVNFEYLEDISLLKINSSDLDDKYEAFYTSLNNNGKYSVIQVKKNNITSGKFKSILYNWLILEHKYSNIENYILCSTYDLNINSLIFDKKNLFKEINESNKKQRALISNVKQAYNNDYELFSEKYNSILSKVKLLNASSIDDMIYDRYKKLLRKTKPTEVIYRLRIEEAMRRIQYDLLATINKRIPYQCDLEKLLIYLEDVCNSISEDRIEMSYIAFKSKIELEIDKIKPTREYKQLMFCYNDNKFIARHIMYELYYENFRNFSLENNRITKINSIENRTYENFEDVVIDLKEENNDTPSRRLRRCKKESNHYIESEEAKYGALIYMTREAEQEQRISWKEDENE